MKSREEDTVKRERGQTGGGAPLDLKGGSGQTGVPTNPNRAKRGKGNNKTIRRERTNPTNDNKGGGQQSWLGERSRRSEEGYRELTLDLTLEGHMSRIKRGLSK